MPATKTIVSCIIEHLTCTSTHAVYRFELAMRADNSWRKSCSGFAKACPACEWQAGCPFLHGRTDETFEVIRALERMGNIRLQRHAKDGDLGFIYTPGAFEVGARNA